MLHSFGHTLDNFSFCDFFLKIMILSYLSERAIRVQQKNMTASRLRITAIPSAQVQSLFFPQPVPFLAVGLKNYLLQP